MLKVNVGLSRKLTRDFQSTGFTVNLEGEVAADLNDAEAVVTRVQEYYDAAEEIILRQIERYESDAAIASRDAEPRVVQESFQRQTSPASNGDSQPANKPSAPTSPNDKGAEPATNKQLQFLLNIGKRHGLSKPQLENRIAEILGRPFGVYDLSKRDAGVVLDFLTAEQQQTAKR